MLYKVVCKGMLPYTCHRWVVIIGSIEFSFSQASRSILNLPRDFVSYVWSRIKVHLHATVTTSVLVDVKQNIHEDSITHMIND